MRVITEPGTVHERKQPLSWVMQLVSADKSPGRAMGELIEMLVEKGVLTLADCRALGGPDMEVAVCD